jgi:hypothetical protein
MSFKSYTRKSSALTGADRAGVSRDCVVQNEEGKWGFHEAAQMELPSAESFVAEPEVTTPPTKNQGDRRKVKRFLYRQLAATRALSKVHDVKLAMTNLIRRDLRKCRNRNATTQIAF